MSRLNRLPMWDIRHCTALLNGLADAAWLVDLHSITVVAANEAAQGLFGHGSHRGNSGPSGLNGASGTSGASGTTLCGLSALALATSAEDLAWWDDAQAGHLSPLHSDTVVNAADGRLLQCSRSIRPVCLSGAAGANGERATHALVMLSDRTAEHLSETRREELLAELQGTLEATADGILVTDLRGGIRCFNRRFAELWGLPMALLQQHDDTAVAAWMSRSLADPAAYEQRLHTLAQATLTAATDRLELVSGQILERVTRPLFNAGRPSGRVWSFRDLSERLADQQRIETLSLQDALTGVANRRRLAEAVASAVAEAQRSRTSLALLVVDLDRFRHINDSLGHAMGDRVLLDVAQRIQGCLRQDDLLARLGGDQFAVLVVNADAAAAQATARRILNVVAQPCSLEDAQFTLTCSVGIALAPSHGSSADELVRHAEAAMRAVKLAGRANYGMHQVRAVVDRRSHMLLDHAMRQALVSGRFRLHYQPQISLHDGRIMGAEALLRWRDPELGEIAPGRFIPVAEDSGFIVPIGDWVLSQAVRQIALWHSRGLHIPVAINVSALQFQQAHFVDRVASVVAVSGIPAALLELELTESILVHEADEALHRLQALSRLGVRLSIDDFGTGYSSLAYLKRFPIDKLKIDRSFITGLPQDDADAGIVRAILQMARALGMKVIAEGVETEAQRQFLQGAGCDEFQGFLFAPALDVLNFEQRLPQTAQHLQPTSPPARIRLVKR